MGRHKNVGELLDQEIARGRAERESRKQRAETLVREIDELRKTITRAFWDVGRRLREMRDEQLHTSLGFERFDAFVEQRLGLSQAGAWKLVAVSEQLPRATATELGQEKAYALVTYTRSQPEPQDPAELVARDAEIGGKPLSQVSVRDLLAAARAARVPRPKSLAQRAADAETKKTLAAMKALLRTKGLGSPTLEARPEGISVVFTHHQISRLLGG